MCLLPYVQPDGESMVKSAQCPHRGRDLQRELEERVFSISKNGLHKHTPLEPMTISLIDLQLGDSFDHDKSQTPASGARRRGNAAPATEQGGGRTGASRPALPLFSGNPGANSDKRAPATVNPLTRLIGMLGPCLSRKSRRGEMYGVRIMAAILTQGINSFLGLEGRHSHDHPVLAASLCEFLVATELPWLLRAPGLSQAALRAEGRDGAR